MESFSPFLQVEMDDKTRPTPIGPSGSGRGGGEEIATFQGFSTSGCGMDPSEEGGLVGRPTRNRRAIDGRARGQRGAADGRRRVERQAAEGQSTGNGRATDGRRTGDRGVTDG